MPSNPAYQPDYYDRRRRVSRENSRRGVREEYLSDDDRGRDRSKYSRRERRSKHGSEEEYDKGRRRESYHSEPERGDSEHDERGRRKDDRRRGDRYYDDYHDPEYYHYTREHPSRPYYNPRDQPYYYPSRDIFHPVFVPDRDPRCQPFYRYESDMRRQPFYMYDPMDMYHPRYSNGPPGHPPARAPAPAPVRSSKKKSKKREVEFQEEIEEQEFDPNEVDPYLIEEVQRSKSRMYLGVLVFLFILLLASVVMGAVAAAMEPWWVMKITSGTTTYESIRVGFWRTCYRSDTKKAWECHQYSESGFQSPYESIALLRWSTVVGTMSAFICLTFTVVALVGRKSRFLMYIIYTIIFFATGATVLFGLVIAYVNEDKKVKKIVGDWTKVNDPNLESGMLFAIGCAATATSGLSLILAAVFAFIYEVEVKSSNDSVFEGVEEKEIKKEVVKKHPPPQRQGTKYVKKDKESEPVRMNGHVVQHKEPAVITKDREPPANIGVPHNSTGIHAMQPRHNYPPRDYGNVKRMQPASHKPEKVQPASKKHEKRSKKPQQNVPATNVANPPQQRSNMQVRPVQLPVTQVKNPKKAPLYDGDYNTYFNTPY